MSDAVENAIQTIQEQLAILRQENVRLTKENVYLLGESYRLITVNSSQNSAADKKIGEQARSDVARWIDGEKPAPGNGYNLVQRQSRQKFQVQYNVQKGSRWTWKRLVKDDRVEYSRLILIGVFEKASATEHHRSGNLPFILFDVPGEDVSELVNRDQQDINVNVSKLTMTDGEIPFERYRVSPEQLTNRYNANLGK